MAYPQILLCLIQGEPFKNAFAVQIDREETVTALKELIVCKNPNYFKEVDPRHLCLWKVNTAVQDDNGLQKLSLKDSDILHPTWQILDSKAFKLKWTAGHLHIIVKAPKQGTYLS